MLHARILRTSTALILSASLIAACGTTDDDDGKGKGQQLADIQYQDAGAFLPPKPTVSICNPCNSSLQCNGSDDVAAKCVSYGDEGSFCAPTCNADSDCTEGYTCGDVNTVEDSTKKAKHCVRKKAAGDTGTYGSCPCTAYAAAKSLATSCIASETLDKGDKVTCPGMRYCTDSGLTACTATKPTAEVCDGLDNNCDGQLDEDTCKDAPECQKGTCHPAAGCTYAPAEGTCDDNNMCTNKDKCWNGACTGDKVSCDDDNSCTKDTCDPKAGCKHEALDKQACDDGKPCTIGDVCDKTKCIGGKDKAKVATAQGGCMDSNDCTQDLCQTKTGACINSVTEGAKCEDGDLCTEGDVCDKSGNCEKGSKAKKCTDGKDCTDDSCDKDKGCVFLPSSSTPCSK
ncbi:MAG: hypothetical protein KC502_13930 [Myxococcales bacterium]|nr:hypothetical protein [Myxococcales bacterium]